MSIHAGELIQAFSQQISERMSESVELRVSWLCDDSSNQISRMKPASPKTFNRVIIGWLESAFDDTKPSAHQVAGWGGYRPWNFS